MKKLVVFTIILASSFHFSFCQNNTSEQEISKPIEVNQPLLNANQNLSKVMVTQPQQISQPAKDDNELLIILQKNRAEAKAKGYPTEEYDIQINELLSRLSHKNNLTERETTLDNSLPTDFPKFIDTGNYEEDTKNYNIAKENWINTHQEEYYRLSHSK